MTFSSTVAVVNLKFPNDVYLAIIKANLLHEFETPHPDGERVAGAVVGVVEVEKLISAFLASSRIEV